MKRLSKNQKGFTLIEVVIVLAIAAALILVVLLAVSGAQKSRRDSQRHDNAGRMESAVEQCLSNNSGILTGKCDTIAKITSYLVNVNDPTTGSGYTGLVSPPAAAGQAYINTSTLGTKLFCDGTTAITAATQYSISVYVEQGGIYCVDDK